jgi:hypothetical protein
MKTLADEIIEGSRFDVRSKISQPVKSLSEHHKSKPKSAGNKSFRIHNSLKFMKSVERSRIGKENKL